MSAVEASLFEGVTRAQLNDPQHWAARTIRQQMDALLAAPVHASDHIAHNAANGIMPRASQLRRLRQEMAGASEWRCTRQKARETAWCLGESDPPSRGIYELQPHERPLDYYSYSDFLLAFTRHYDLDDYIYLVLAKLSRWLFLGTSGLERLVDLLLPNWRLRWCRPREADAQLLAVRLWSQIPRAYLWNVQCTLASDAGIVGVPEPRPRTLLSYGFRRVRRSDGRECFEHPLRPAIGARLDGDQREPASLAHYFDYFRCQTDQRPMWVAGAYRHLALRLSTDVADLVARFVSPFVPARGRAFPDLIPPKPPRLHRLLSSDGVASELPSASDTDRAR